MEDRPHHWTLVVAIAAILTAATSALFTYLQWHEANQARLEAKEAAKSQSSDVKKSADAADRSARAAEKSAGLVEQFLADSKSSFTTSERPWLNVANIDTHIPTDGMSSAKVDTTITNYGKSPAYKVRVSQMVSLTLRVDQVPDLKGVATTNPYIIPPTQFVVMKSTPRFAISIEELNALMQKRLFLQISGQVEYLDVFGKHHITKWCAYSAPDKGETYACPFNNTSS